jgi:hypothetical protein
VKKNPLVETVLFDLSSTSLSRDTEEGVGPPARRDLAGLRKSQLPDSG